MAIAALVVGQEAAVQAHAVEEAAVQGLGQVREHELPGALGGMQQLRVLAGVEAGHQGRDEAGLVWWVSSTPSSAPGRRCQSRVKPSRSAPLGVRAARSQGRTWPSSRACRCQTPSRRCALRVGSQPSKGASPKASRPWRRRKPGGALKTGRGGASGRLLLAAFDHLRRRRGHGGAAGQGLAVAAVLFRLLCFFVAALLAFGHGLLLAPEGP
ncbi:MAG: hypothetical protein ACK5PF_03805 [bacterium]